jgi:hypothetical protein
MFYRLQMRLKYSYFKYRTRGIEATVPTPCDSASGCELHTMLGQRDLPMYLVAVKSLLRFYPAVAVVVHSDGTLTAEGEALLSRHVPGCKLLRAAETDAHARRVLGGDSFLLRCRGFDVNFRRLIDTELWGTTRKRIIMDSDVLVQQPPSEVIDWVERGEGPFLMGETPPPFPPAAKEVSGDAHVQTVFKARLGQLSSALGFPAAFQDGTTAGFYGCTGELPLDRIERVVRKCIDLRIPLEHWGSDQCVVIYLLSVAGAGRLSPENYFNFWPGDLHRVRSAHVIHFLGTNRFYKNVYTTLAARVVRELQARRRVPVVG